MSKRGFEVAKGFEEAFAELHKAGKINLPSRKTKLSAGYDISSIENVLIRPNQMVVVNTGVKVFMPDNEFLDVRVRSSIAFKSELLMVNCAAVIDADYYGNPDTDGPIMIGLRNLGGKDVRISAGDRIAQGIFTKYHVVKDEVVTTVRKGGTGSTGE